MSYTTDLINKRRGQNISGSQIDGSQVDKKKSSEKITFTQNLIEQRRQNYDSFNTSRQNISDERFSISQPEPERKGFIAKVKGEFQDFGEKRQQQTDIFSKTKKAIQGAKDWAFGSNKEVIERQKVDLIQKVSSKKAEGKTDKEAESQLSMIAKIEDPNVDEATKQQFRQYIRLSRFGQSIQASTAQLFAGILGVSRQQEEAEAERQAKFSREMYEKRKDKPTGEYWKKEMEYFEAVRDGTGKTRAEDAIDKLDKWTDEVDVAYPTNAEKVANAGGSMAVFATLSLLTKGSASVPLVVEAVGEAGSTYNTNRNNNKSIKDSSNRANITFVANIIIGKFLNIFDDIGADKGIKAIIKGTGTEAGQEGSQQIISNLATDRPVEEGLVESVIIGGLLGGTTTIVYPSPSQVTTGIPTNPDTFINELIATDFAKTKDGQKLIKTALDAQKQGKALLVNFNENGETSISISKEAYTPAEVTGNLADEISEDGAEKVSPTLPDRGEVAPGKDVKKVDAQSKRGEDGLVVGDIKPTREISNLVDGFSSSEKQIKKLEDILSLTSAVDDPKKFNKIEGEIDKIETGNRNAVKQISKKLNVSEFEVITALSEFIDIGSRRGKTTLTDFYNFFRKDIAVKETPKEKTQREETQEVIEPNVVEDNEIGNYYKEQDQEAVGQAFYEVIAELDIAQAGQRIYDADGKVTGGVSSTFPQWIPSELRSRKLFDNVMDGLSDPTNIKFPPNSQPRKQALYEEILSQIDGRADTDSGDIIERIKNAKETTKKTTNKTSKTDDRSSKRGEEKTKPVPKKELDKLEEKIVEQKEPEVKPKEKPKKKYEAQEPGQIKASKVAVSIEQKLGEKLENIAGFESINIKDQLKKAEDLLNKNLIRARGMISGKIPLPDGLRAGAFVVAVEEYAKQTNDMSLLRSLAVSPLVSETSIHAQELRLLAERDRDSVLSKMQEIANERAKVAERKYGSKVDKLIKEETKKVKESIKKVDKHLWKDFLKNIEC